MNERAVPVSLAARCPASLRDPSGFVFESDGRVFRSLNPSGALVWRDFCRSGLADELMSCGALISTTDASDEIPPITEGGLTLEHERIPVISYSFEWSFSQLREVALIHLNLLLRLLPAGWWLKDAEPSNVQWRRGSFVFIDIGSFEAARDEPWKAYGQFCRTMFFPLLIAAHTGISVNKLLRGFGGTGIDAKTTRCMLGFSNIFKSGVAVHVFGQSLLQDLSRDMDDNWHRQIHQQKVERESTVRLILNLKEVIQCLKPPLESSWSHYQGKNSYSKEESRKKEEVVAKWFSTLPSQPNLALDIGCNTGTFTRICARYAKLAVGIDNDAVCVDSINMGKPLNMLGLVVDFSDSTPSSGWQLRERLSFPSRVKPDVTLALAVVHHLALGCGIALDEVIRALIGSSPILFIEFISLEDDMAKALYLRRISERPDYSVGAFIAAIAATGGQIECVESLSPTRTLYLVRRVNGPTEVCGKQFSGLN